MAKLSSKVPSKQSQSENKTQGQKPMTLPFWLNLSWLEVSGFGTVLIISHCEQFVFCFLCHYVWDSWDAVEDGWVQIIRGPCPPAEVWPRVGNVSAAHPKLSVAGRASSSRLMVPAPEDESDAAREMPQSIVVRLEKALSSMSRSISAASRDW